MSRTRSCHSPCYRLTLSVAMFPSLSSFLFPLWHLIESLTTPITDAVSKKIVEQIVDSVLCINQISGG
jgi:hypothetical protein